MSYIQLPQLTYINKIYNYIEHIKTTDEKTEKEKTQPIINITLYKYLNTIKREIDNCATEWDRYKKYTNPYEYIHTPVSGTSVSICRLKPLSRSYFKMIEICNLLSILKEMPSGIKSFHLAEGPGGFIEAISDMRKTNNNACYNKNDTYYGMTLIDNSDTSIPGWSKTKELLSKCKSIFIENGVDNRGDLTNPDNLLYCYKKYCNTIDLVTGDGGFDFSVDFNKQEMASSKLIFCQIAFAISMQKIGGTFIIKFFDTFTNISVNLIHLLTILYANVYYVKPYTSRHANSEKYIVCKNFRINKKDREPLIKKFLEIYKDENFDNMFGILNIPLPYLLNVKIEECNATCGQQQMECIANTINLIENNTTEKLELLKKSNIQKCKNWCLKYKLPYHKNIVSTNIFLQK